MHFTVCRLLLNQSQNCCFYNNFFILVLVNESGRPPVAGSQLSICYIAEQRPNKNTFYPTIDMT